MNSINSAIEMVGGPSAMARIVGVSAQLACFWRDGKRGVPVDKCAAIELATGGKVMRWDLRPHDWREIWPELAQRPDAPALANTAQAATETVAQGVTNA